jgi:hypothetical protein
MKDESDVVRAGPSGSALARGHFAGNVEDTSGCFDAWGHFDDRDAARLSRCACSRFDSCLNQEQLCAQIAQIEIKLPLAIGRVKRGNRRASRDAEESHGHFWSVRQHNSHTIVSANANISQVSNKFGNFNQQLPIRKRSTA